MKNLLFHLWFPLWHLHTVGLPRLPAPPTLPAMVRHTAVKLGVNPNLAYAVLYTENGGNFRGAAVRVSCTGAIGPMQLEPITARTLHVNPWNVQQNIKGGILYLRYLLHRFDGSIWLAIEAYNAGPTAVATGNVPQSAVTYATNVIRRM